jgi:hypothetical protein
MMKSAMHIWETVHECRTVSRRITVHSLVSDISVASRISIAGGTDRSVYHGAAQALSQRKTDAVHVRCTCVRRPGLVQI